MSFFIVHRINETEDQGVKLSLNQKSDISKTVDPSEDDKNVSVSDTVGGLICSRLIYWWIESEVSKWIFVFNSSQIF